MGRASSEAVVSTVFLAGLLAGCGGASAPSHIDGADDPSRRLERLVLADARSAAVFHRLQTANLDVCPVTGVSAGWSLHAAGQYGPALRSEAEARFGLDRDLPGVLSVAPGGSADRAGLRAGDLILSVNGQDLAPGPIATVAAYEGFRRNAERIDAALEHGETELRLRRADQDMTLRIVADPACGYSLHVEPGEQRNARTDGRGVFISAGLANFAAADDELALLLGHELAHLVLGHRSPDGRLTAAGRVGDAERQADRTGLCLAVRAGYSVDGAGAFWRRFGAADWRARYPQLGHPSAETRARALDAATGDIKAAGDCMEIAS